MASTPSDRKRKKKSHRKDSERREKRKHKRQREGVAREERSERKRRREDETARVASEGASAPAVATSPPDAAEKSTWDHLNTINPDRSGKVLVTVRAPDPSVDPVVVSFPGGVPESILRVEESARKRVRFPGGPSSSSEDVIEFRWSRAKSSSSRGRTVRGADGSCLYESSCGGRKHDGRLTKLYVGLYDAKSKSLTVQPVAERGTTFALSQSVRSYEETDKSIGRAATAGMTLAERRRLLFESFGSAKKQKALRSQAANVVSVDSVVGSGDAMMGAVGRQEYLSESNKKAMEAAEGKAKGGAGAAQVAREGTMGDAVEAALAEARRSVLPTFDESASEPHEVYDAIDIIGEEAWDTIVRFVDACIGSPPNGDGDVEYAANWRETLGSSSERGNVPSIVSLLEGLDPAKRGHVHRIRIAVLLRHFVAFHFMFESRPWGRPFRGDAEELARLFDVPMDSTVQLCATMAVLCGRNAYASSKQMRDKRLVHMLILYLMAHGKDMKCPSMNDFCRDIMLDLSEAANLLREAGCTVKRNTTSGMVSVGLTVPLTFPPPKMGRKVG